MLGSLGREPEKTATTSKEGSRPENYLIPTRGGSDKN